MTVTATSPSPADHAARHAPRVADEYIDAEILRHATSVPRVAYDRAVFERAVRAATPIIVQGALDHWPAMSKWTLDYFDQRWGEQSILATQVAFPKGATPYGAKAADVHRIATVGHCIERLRQDDPAIPVYLNQNDADAVFPGSRDDLRYDDLLSGVARAGRPPAVWLGTRGTRSGLHWDGFDNVMAVFAGAKAFVLSPPGHYRRLYPMTENWSKSRIDPARVDWQRFPRLREASMLTGVLTRGDVLFLPKGWWHYFVTWEQCINATVWFGGLLRARLFQHYGLTHAGRYSWQFAWHGVMGRPYERRALSPPPLGLLRYNALRRKLAARMGTSDAR